MMNVNLCRRNIDLFDEWVDNYAYIRAYLGLSLAELLCFFGMRHLIMVSNNFEIFICYFFTFYLVREMYHEVWKAVALHNV